MRIKNNSGFIPVIVIILIVLVATALIGGSYLANNRTANLDLNTPTPTPSVLSSSTPIVKNIVKKTSTPKSTSNSTTVSVSVNPTTVPTPTLFSNSTFLPKATSTPTPTSSVDTSGTITINTSSVNVTLSRASIGGSGLIFGSGFTITSQGATGWQIHYNEGTSGQGFYESSGGITPGSTTTIRTYINSNKANGIYSGSAVVEYYKNGSWLSGPTVSYSITLID